MLTVPDSPCLPNCSVFTTAISSATHYHSVCPVSCTESLPRLISAVSKPCAKIFNRLTSVTMLCLCYCRTSATPCKLSLLMWRHTACSLYAQNHPHQHLRQLRAPAKEQQPAATAQPCPQKQHVQATAAQATLPVHRRSSLQLCPCHNRSQPTVRHCQSAVTTQTPHKLQMALSSM